jgi:omega-amidase
MNDLNLCLIQTALDWESPSLNRSHLYDKIMTAREVDVIVLPEMFTTGFSMNTAALAEGEEGESLQWMKELAKKKNCAITGSVMIKTDGHCFNRLYFVDEQGKVSRYDKRHLFRMAAEHHHYQAGQAREIIHYRGWRICPLICYDLRFPVFSRNNVATDPERKPVYDLLLYVANWPERRASAWRALLPARAIENLCYTAGVNRVGVDGNNISYSGDSGVFNYLGESLCSAQQGEETWLYARLSASSLNEYRTKFPAWQDAD